MLKTALSVISFAIGAGAALGAANMLEEPVSPAAFKFINEQIRKTCPNLHLREGSVTYPVRQRSADGWVYTADFANNSGYLVVFETKTGFEVEDVSCPKVRQRVAL